jgi:ATP-dependent RNA helicase DDX10/DBP4
MDRETEDIAQLEKKISSQCPGTGKLLLDEDKFTKFCDFPLSGPTLKGLGRGKFTTCTQIQRQTLFHALSGRDILGAAKTGRLVYLYIVYLYCFIVVIWMLSQLPY